MANLYKKPMSMEESLNRMELQLQSFVADSMKRLEKLEKDHNHQVTSIMHASLKFPEFDLRNLNFWIRRCNSFFELCQIPDHQKMGTTRVGWCDVGEVLCGHMSPVSF
ncbi:hypothetical protein P3S68_010964 [Capsicum galapagoense]